MSKWEGRGVVTGGRHDRGGGSCGGGGGYVVMSVCLCVWGGA